MSADMIEFWVVFIYYSYCIMISLYSCHSCINSNHSLLLTSAQGPCFINIGLNYSYIMIISDMLKALVIEISKIELHFIFIFMYTCKPKYDDINICTSIINLCLLFMSMVTLSHDLTTCSCFNNKGLG